MTDGIEVGRPCCSVRHCTVPLASTQDRFCPAHHSEALRCVVIDCITPIEPGFRTCSDTTHRAIETRYRLLNKAAFHLRARLQRSKVMQPNDSLHPTAQADEVLGVDSEGVLEMEVQDAKAPCADKPVEGSHRLRAMFGRRRTHNEQLFVRPCGIIIARDTCYGSETVPQIAVSE